MAATAMLFAGASYGPMVGAFAIIKDWRNSYYATVLYTSLTLIPIFLSTESPRTELRKGRREAAEAGLARLAKLNKVQWTGNLNDSETAGEDQIKPEGFFTKVRSIFVHRVLFLETCCLALMWQVVYLSYFGINYAWDNLVPDASIAFILSMVIQICSYSAFIVMVSRVGIRRYMMVSFLGAGVLFAVAISGYPIGGGGWTVASIASILTCFLTGGAYCGVMMWTVEAAPASHTGTVFGICSMLAKVVGMASPALFGTMTRMTGGNEAPFGVLSFLGLVSGVVAWWMVDTTGKPIAGTPLDVNTRRKAGRGNRGKKVDPVIHINVMAIETCD